MDHKRSNSDAFDNLQFKKLSEEEFRKSCRGNSKVLTLECNNEIHKKESDISSLKNQILEMINKIAK